MRISQLLWIGIVTLCCAACTVTPTASPPPVTSSYDPDAVSVTWEIRNHQDFYQIGDGFRLELIITNENGIPVSFPGLYLRGLNFGFVTPSVIHLIAPNGEDVLLPYQTLEGLTGYADPITVAAQGGYYFDFVIPSRFKLWQPGAYTLWAELQDEFGTLHRVRFGFVGQQTGMM